MVVYTTHLLPGLFHMLFYHMQIGYILEVFRGKNLTGIFLAATSSGLFLCHEFFQACPDASSIICLLRACSTQQLIHRLSLSYSRV